MAPRNIELHDDQIFDPEFNLDNPEDVQEFALHCRYTQTNANRLYYGYTHFVFTLSKDPHLAYFFRALEIFFATIGHRNARRVRHIIVDVQNTDWDTLTEEAITRLWRMHDETDFYITLRIGGGCPYLQDVSCPVEGVAFDLFDWEEALNGALAAIEFRKESTEVNWSTIAAGRLVFRLHDLIDIFRKVENAPERLAQ